MKGHLPFIREFSIVYIELLLTVLSNFEKECLTHKVLGFVYSLIANPTGLAWHMVWHIQYLWFRVAEWGGIK